MVGTSTLSLGARAQGTGDAQPGLPGPGDENISEDAIYLLALRMESEFDCPLASPLDRALKGSCKAWNPWRSEPHVTGPYPSPATSGGIYAIRKDPKSTGSKKRLYPRVRSGGITLSGNFRAQRVNNARFFDPELIRWGGDHVEASLKRVFLGLSEASHKVWRCGGRVEIHPCSRVGHWFRTEEATNGMTLWISPEERPYTVRVTDVAARLRSFCRFGVVQGEELQTAGRGLAGWPQEFILQGDFISALTK